jgi:hypothetical protein
MTKRNKKFLEEQFAYFPFTVTLVPDTASRKKTSVWMRNEVSKTIQFVRLQCCYYCWDCCMRYTVDMASDGTIYVSGFMKISPGIQVKLRLLPQQTSEVLVLVLLMTGIS